MLPGRLMLRTLVAGRRSVASVAKSNKMRTVSRASVALSTRQVWAQQSRLYADDHHAHSEPNYFPDDQTVAPDGKKIFTRAEVGQHNTEQDAWVVIKDRVFNVTTWIPLHPGGRKFILSVVGRDATDAFSERGHSHVAFEVLEELHIGYIREKGRYSGKPLAELW